MTFDLVVSGARIAGRGPGLLDIGISNGRIVTLCPDIESDGPVRDVGGRLVVPGFVETHIHLDKSNLLGICDCHSGSLSEAIEKVASAKLGFTEDDVYDRASRTLEKAILHGTMRMRTHLEVDPRVGLTSFHALTRLKRDYAWAVDLELCAFPQEGLIDDPGCEEFLVSAMIAGADVVGGAPYMDRDSHAHIARIFDIAQRFDVDIDMHLDFSLDPAHLDVEEICRRTDADGLGGHVTVGHMTKLSSVPPEQLDTIGRRLASMVSSQAIRPTSSFWIATQRPKRSPKSRQCYSAINADGKASQDPQLTSCGQHDPPQSLTPAGGGTFSGARPKFAAQPLPPAGHARAAAA